MAGSGADGRAPAGPGDERHRAASPAAGLDPGRERDACGVGFVARVTGERSSDVLQDAVEALSRLSHRGASSGDNVGDGAGLLTQIPHRLFLREARRLGVRLREDDPLGVGVFFLPADDGERARAEGLVEGILAGDGLPFLGWRDVPVDPAALGPGARATRPAIRQLLVGPPAGPYREEEFERALFLARRGVEIAAARKGLRGLYCCSLSCRTVVYKALLTGRQMPAFFEDLNEPDYETAVAVFHQRFSTNTLPSWELAHPFRLLAHNGEINTLWGNRNAMAMRAPMLDSPLWAGKGERVRDPIWKEGSDSASLDNALELLVRSGRDPLEGILTLLPQAWEKYPDVNPDVRAFYEYQQGLLEPWDGPAAVAFTDGLLAGAAVDRNGLRPCRWKLRRDGLVVAGSEVGVVDLDPRDVVECGGVGPGEVLLVDLVGRRLVRNRDAKIEIATRRPYRRWVVAEMPTLAPTHEGIPAPLSPTELACRQADAGWTAEDLKYVVAPMAETGAEAVWSMGDDTPIPPLATFPRPLYSFFRQRFAQVTNPPVDPLRESMVMSLRMHLGRCGSPLVEDEAAARLLRLEHPVLLPGEMASLRAQEEFPVATLDAVWEGGGGDDLRRALEELAARGSALVNGETQVLVLSDRASGPLRPPIPMLLALGAVRSRLVREGIRARAGLVVEAADAFDVHHVACLFGYGAEAVFPWLVYESLPSLLPDRGDAAATWRSAAGKGLLKVLSKMGISTLSGYCGAQIFEALGLGAEVVDLCFAGTASPLGGLGFAELAEDALARHRAAWPEGKLPDPGRVRFKRDGEEHAYAPPVVSALQQAARAGSAEAWDGYVAKAAGHPPASPRDLLDFAPAEAVPLEEVEPAASILARFVSSAMSLGALSPEAHETLTLAMNRIGALSNCGEGGEDPERYRETPDGVRADNRIKQVASGRFGVTAEYLARADELEIKVAQGAKPGEGGQLPGHKVTGLVARLRHAAPGVTLISPPPHHDVYSIEDLAQLIHDLKCVNPRARVGVKLVSTTGVGTIAAGVAKAYADYVLIAGHSGGTGASPLSSIKSTGMPWEVGLAETQRALVANGLRHRIEVRVDGGLRTARDVLVGALLGAERFGFGTAALVAIGCVMARQCHLNTCPTGIATQKEELRARFKGTPERAALFFTLLAEEVRRLLARLGARSLDEVVGRSDLLVRVERPEAPRARLLDLGPLLAGTPGGAPRRRSVPRNDRPGLVSLDAEVLHDLAPCLDAGLPFSGSYPIRSHHLSVGARVSGEIAARFGGAGLPDGAVRLRFTGSAGQSFGAFLARGVSVDLEGEANDTVGKGLSGGEIAIRPFRQAAWAARTHENLILGNTALYGATAGRLFAAGRAGNRFAVRNSGAVAVVEGTGNHACEYMTGGLVLVLGTTGRNFAAGMSDGLAYALDEDGAFPLRVNGDMAGLAPLDGLDERLLLVLLDEHRRRTGSPRAAALLDSWGFYFPLFRKVVPHGAEERADALRRDLLEADGTERRTA